MNIPDANSFVQLAKSFILFGGNFYKQQLVLGKLSYTVKSSTFGVSFIPASTILGWL